ncbi:hypothetical protein EK21DRAFT_111270 [Setomelanomma holmii]|uniref:Uncharacterized protein n=1 Tax=Setomelanomma holmii TaxID=210430 RepID=A0A9P4HAD8_9PLEO|nr:hypothetical protein EK21DRAFT_111270 [Setomelanomma holmii]
MALNIKTSTSPSIEPFTPPAGGRCLILALPRELRDHVYEYALTDDYCLTAAMVAVDVFELQGSSSSLSPYRDFNQLQYVSRQIRSEIRGLTLKLNDLHFRGTQFPAIVGTDIAESFLAQCSASTKAMLSKLIIYYGDFFRGNQW